MSQELTAEQRFEVHHYSEMGKLIRAMKEQFGEEVCQVVAKHYGDRAFTKWKEEAEKSESNSIESLIELLWEPLSRWKPLPESGFEYEQVETESGIQMKCTRCCVYDLAKYCGITEEAYYIFCANDPYIVEGFNPNIGFKRTKTLMQGHDCCNHFYYYKDK